MNQIRSNYFLQRTYTFSHHISKRLHLIILQELFLCIFCLLELFSYLYTVSKRGYTYCFILFVSFFKGIFHGVKVQIDPAQGHESGR